MKLRQLWVQIRFYRSPWSFHIKTLTFITVHLTDLDDEMELCRLYLDLDQRVLCYRALPSKLGNPIFSWDCLLAESIFCIHNTCNNHLYLTAMRPLRLGTYFEYHLSSVFCTWMKFTLHLCLVIKDAITPQKITKQANKQEKLIQRKEITEKFSVL